MIFSAPIPFAEALKAREVKTTIASTRSHEEWSQFKAELRERSFWSARVNNAEFLDEAGSLIDRIVAGVSPGPGQYMDMPTARLLLKQHLERIDYQPDDPGTIQDLSSDGRLNLILRTNTDMARGYGQFVQENDADALDEFPCRELVREKNRRTPRGYRRGKNDALIEDDAEYWEHRWEEAGGRLYDGRMIARKDDDVWVKLSAFDLPYPPFDFNSGMGILEVPREESEALGVIDPGEKVEGQDRGFNEDIEMTPDIRDERLRAALESSLGDDFEFDGDTLKREG